jgi:hypothetical protein
MTRPVGVTILAVLHYIGAALAVLVGLALIFGMSILGSIIASNAGQGKSGIIGFMAGFGVVLGIFAFFGAAIAVLLGWGLWKLKNWARIIVIVLACIRAGFASLALLGSLIHFNPLVIGWAVDIAINGIIAWYLLQPHVKQAFTAAPAITAAGA